MAYEFSNGTTVPHATDHSDLLAKLRTFVNAQGGVQQEYVAGDRYIVKLTGGGSDSIYVGLKVYANAGDNSYALILQGYTGFTSGQAFDNHPGAIGSNPPALALWNSSIQYWFLVSGRRIIIVAKVGSTYQMAYLGWIQPYGTPGQWPYPLLIGGSTYRGDTDNSAKPYLYSNTNAKTCNFWHPLNEDGSQGTLALRTPSGWAKLLNVSTAGHKNSGTSPYYKSGMGNHRRLLDSQYLHRAVIVLDGGSQPAKYGEFDGLRHVTGENLTAESTITEGGDTYVAFPNVARTALQHWVLVKQA
jgi:hypothetical protein